MPVSYFEIITFSANHFICLFLWKFLFIYNMVVNTLSRQPGWKAGFHVRRTFKTFELSFRDLRRLLHLLLRCSAMRSLTLVIWRFKDVLRSGSLVFCQRDLRRRLRSISSCSFLRRTLEKSECMI